MQPGKKIAILADFPLHFLPSSSYPLPLGHYATWLPQLAQALEGETKLQIHWITLDSFVETEKEHTVWNQKFHVLPTWRRGRAATLFWADRRRIQRKIRQIDPDLVHGWGNENIWGWASVESGRKNIFSIQGLLGLYGKLGHHGLRDWMMARIEAKVLRRALVLTAESPWTIEQVSLLFGRRDVKLIEYGVPQEFFQAKYTPDTKNPYALMVGTADYRKGIDFAVQLFSRPELAGIRLKVVGGLSPFGEGWKKTASPNIEWLGRKKQSDIVSLMSGATCLLLPTRGDTGPTVAKEARVIGLPIVASPHGGHIQYVENEANGFICSLASPQHWARVIRVIFNDPNKAQNIGLGHQAEHRELLKPERTAAKILALYREMIGSGEIS